MYEHAPQAQGFGAVSKVMQYRRIGTEGREQSQCPRENPGEQGTEEWTESEGNKDGKTET